MEGSVDKIVVLHCSLERVTFRLVLMFLSCLLLPDAEQIHSQLEVRQYRAAHQSARFDHSTSGLWRYARMTMLY
jgi:hypothetical protein